MADDWIPVSDWRTIVQHVPIVSVDILVRVNDGLVFGKRQNEPAAGHWFVPGGRVKKGETREKAVHRVAAEELGIDVKIVESLGAYEHLYDLADVEGVGGKHYLANGYVVDAKSTSFETDDQHTELAIFHEPPEPLHKYVQKYLSDAEILSNWS